MAQKKKKFAKSTHKKPLRQYDNSWRAEKSAEKQKAVMEALVGLLVEKNGGEVSFEELAEKTGITKRTIFRFFNDKETLHQAMDQYLMSYLQAGMQQLEALNFVGFGKNAFKIFDRHEALVTAYVLSPFGQDARRLFRKKLNHMMIERIKKEKNIEIDSNRLKRLAVITSLINAKIWYDVRSDFGFSGEEMSDSIEWALSALLEKL